MDKVKVAVIQGPLVSVGRNFLTSHLYAVENRRTPEAEREYVSTFDARCNLIEVARALHVLGFKVVMSGWESDRGWLEDHSAHFDELVLSDERTVKGVPWHRPSMKHREYFINNKQKMYLASLNGLIRVRDVWGNVPVLKTRADMYWDFLALDEELSQIGPTHMVLDSMNIDASGKIHADSLGHSAMLAYAELLLATFQDLYDRAVQGRSYDELAHGDYLGALMQLAEKGLLTDLSPSRPATLESWIWRGVPRYASRFAAAS